MSENGNGNGKWAQIVASIVLAFLTLAQVGVLWILTDMKTDFRGHKAEFYDKIDRVVKYYHEGQRTTIDAIKSVCENQTIMFKGLEKHETLLHFNHPQRKEYFKEHKP